MPQMATLPRLMQPGPSQSIDPDIFADTNDGISGNLDIMEMQGLHSSLSKTEGTLSYQLLFGRDERGRISISGNYHTELEMLCQRCLGAMRVPIQKSINVAVVANDEDAVNLPRRVEPLVLVERKLSLVRFLKMSYC